MNGFIMRFPVLTVVAIMALSIIGCQSGTDSAEQTSTESQKEVSVKHMDANAVHAYLTGNPKVTVLDIRTPQEFAEGHIDGAVLIDFKDAAFTSNIAKLDKTAAYVVHCRSGGRSTKSLDVFRAQGFTHITHLDGGIIGWKAANLPLTK